jgi:hypothetical protein
MDDAKSILFKKVEKTNGLTGLNETPHRINLCVHILAMFYTTYMNFIQTRLAVHFLNYFQNIFSPSGIYLHDNYCFLVVESIPLFLLSYFALTFAAEVTIITCCDHTTPQ